ncbi:hypothetical protein [Dongia sedimenti]|uniref:Uncharacterized protein n=1 Tax=Dongia sedimenti TaxID=3064282 RepID=A0ABU0YK93_9PROT|nr:hypothetical protein [Rhodospirillaceae bacterium R-7]
MQPISSFELYSNRRALTLELAEVDARQLLDMGLVRAADGSLRLAEDPSRQVAPEPLQRRLWALWRSLVGFVRWVRGLPLKSPDWRPQFIPRE